MNKLIFAQFYITNVCNLNCTNCNHFNNFAFTGHQYWNDYADIYAQWAKVLHIDEISIFGGEPLLNPDFPNWLDGVANLWPNSLLRITTNGTQIKHRPKLYDQLLKYKDRITLDISLHNSDFKEEINKYLDQLLVKPITKTYSKAWMSDSSWSVAWKQVADPSWPDCPTPEDFIKLPKHIQDECHNIHHISLDIWRREVDITHIVDANGITVDLTPSWHFHETTIIHNPITNQLSLNHSNPEEAIAVCHSKKCHHFVRGKLYKCPPVSVLPEFIRQFPVEMTDEDRQLIDSYTPAEVNWPDQQLSKFVKELEEYKSIPQCTFCPSKMNPQTFKAGTKKIKIVKL